MRIYPKLQLVWACPNFPGSLSSEDIRVIQNAKSNLICPAQTEILTDFKQSLVWQKSHLWVLQSLRWHPKKCEPACLFWFIWILWYSIHGLNPLIPCLSLCQSFGGSLSGGSSMIQPPQSIFNPIRGQWCPMSIIERLLKPQWWVHSMSSNIPLKSGHPRLVRSVWAE